MTGLLLVVCSMTLGQRHGLQTHDHQSWSLNVKPGDRRVLLSGVDNEQRLQCLISRAHWDNLVQCHGQLWRPEDRACTRLTQTCAAKTHTHTKSLNQQALWFHKSMLMTVHNCRTQYNTEQLWKSLPLPLDKHHSLGVVSCSRVGGVMWRKCLRQLNNYLSVFVERVQIIIPAASFPSTRWRPSGVNLNITCSRSPILTLSCDLYCVYSFTVTALVVLAVALLLRRL